MTPSYKQTCGCEICLSAASMHELLNAFHVCLVRTMEQEIKNMQEGHDKLEEQERLSLYKTTVFPQGQPLHSKASDTMKVLMSPNVEAFVFLKWHCVLCQCKMGPKYSIPKEKKGEDADSKKFNFHV